MGQRETRRRPYRLTTSAATEYFSGVREYVHGTYSTLERACAAARRRHAALPDSTLAIEYRGRDVREVYHHGDPAGWTPEADRG